MCALEIYSVVLSQKNRVPLRLTNHLPNEIYFNMIKPRIVVIVQHAGTDKDRSFSIGFSFDEN